MLPQFSQVCTQQVLVGMSLFVAASEQFIPADCMNDLVVIVLKRRKHYTMQKYTFFTYTKKYLTMGTESGQIKSYLRL